jgi:hypothetical protein
MGCVIKNSSRGRVLERGAIPEMIVVKVELWSAIDGQKTELARMSIANDGRASVVNRNRGDYIGETFVGRDTEALDKSMRTERVSKRGEVKNHARLQEHVWNLVAKMLSSMGYGQ